MIDEDWKKRCLNEIKKKRMGKDCKNEDCRRMVRVEVKIGKKKKNEFD